MKIRWTKQAEGEETEVFLEKGTAIPETFQKLGKKRGGDCRIAVKKEGFSEEEWTKMLCNGVCSLYDGAYQFSKSGLKSLGKQSVYENRDSLSDYGDNCYTFVLEGTEQEIAALERGEALGRCKGYARTLGNLPNNYLHTEDLASYAQTLAQELGISCEIYGDQKLEELGVPAPTKWSDLWDERLKGEILMQDSVRDAFMVALKELGYSMNTTDVGELEEAKKLLLAQKPLVQAYVVDQVRDKMLNGEAAVGVIYSGELLYLQEEAETLDLDYDLEYVLPKEGTNLWIDSWVIPDNAKNKENAEKWINFLCRPDIAVKNFEYITYATPNKAAFEILDPEYQENKSVFPDTDELENSEVYSYLGTEADDLYNALWKEVKSQ